MKSLPFARVLVATMLVALTTPVARAEDGAPAPDPDAALRAFAQRYEQSVNRGDVGAVNGCLDVSTIIQRSHQGLDVPPAFLRGFVSGVREGLDWGGALTQGLGDEGHYRLLRVYRDNGRPRALYRLVNGQGGLNYHELRLEETSGSFEIIDVYIYLSGELISETVRRSLLQFLAAMDEGDDEYLQAVGAVRTMAAQSQSGARAEALRTYRGMPASMQQDKPVMIMRISCAALVDEAELIEACNAFRDLYPDDPCVDLLTVDQLVVRGQWNEAIAAFERIRRAVVDDAYLDDLIANVYRQQGRFGRARTFAERSITKEPTLDEGYWTLLELSIAEKDHDETARLLTTLERQFGWQFEALDTLEPYATFVTSPAYDRWLASRRVSQVD